MGAFPNLRSLDFVQRDSHLPKLSAMFLTLYLAAWLQQRFFAAPYVGAMERLGRFTCSLEGEVDRRAAPDGPGHSPSMEFGHYVGKASPPYAGVWTF
jgi:hypothetical protein